MINAEIPKNIEEFEPKIAGPFTMRQLVCLLLAAVPVGILAYVLNIYFVPKLTIPVCVVVALPFLLCGWWKPFDLGLPFEKFIVNYVRQKFILPYYRRYESDPQKTEPDYVDVNLRSIYEEYNGFELEKEFLKGHAVPSAMVKETEEENSSKKKSVKKNKSANTEMEKRLEADRKEIGYYQ